MPTRSERVGGVGFERGKGSGSKGWVEREA